MIRKLKNIATGFVAVAFLLAGTSLAAADEQVKYADLEKHWAKDSIQLFHEQGYIKGYGDSTFKPDNKITRAEFLTVLNETFKLTGTSDISFKDVKSDDWYYKQLQTAISNGYIKGYEDNTFRGNSPITRAEACVMLVRANKITPEKTTDEKILKEVPAWAADSVAALYSAKIIKGYADGGLHVNNQISRAESVVTMDRFKKYDGKPGEPAGDSKKSAAKADENSQGGAAAPSAPAAPATGGGASSGGGSSSGGGASSGGGSTGGGGTSPTTPPSTGDPGTPGSGTTTPPSTGGNTTPQQPSDPPSTGGGTSPTTPPSTGDPGAPGSGTTTPPSTGGNTTPQQPSDPPSTGDPSQDPAAALKAEQIKKMDKVVQDLKRGRGGKNLLGNAIINHNFTRFETEQGEPRAIYWAMGITPPEMSDFETDNSVAGFVTYSVPQGKGSGWYDVNKSSFSIAGTGFERSMCYAAVSSNQLHWWLEQNSEYIAAYINKKEEQGYDFNRPGSPLLNLKTYIDSYKGQSDSKLYEMCKTYFKHWVEGSYPDVVNDFFINGYKPLSSGARNMPEKFQADSSGGFFSEVFSPTEQLTLRWGEENYTTVKRDIAILMQQGDLIGIIYESATQGITHVVTLWGVEYDYNGEIVAIYITDSDDQEEPQIGLRKFFINRSDGQARATTRTDRKGGPRIVEISSLSLGKGVWQRYLND